MRIEMSLPFSNEVINFALMLSSRPQSFQWELILFDDPTFA